MMTLSTLISDRLRQLEDRKFMIPRYVKKPGSFLGKKDFSLDDLPKIQLEIDECKAALRAIEEVRATRKQQS